MARYTRTTRVAAPLSAVWEFHVRPEGLEALTPAFMRLRVEAVRGPGGERDLDVLEAGAEVDVAVRPFGVGPGLRWTSRVVERERGDDRARFVDEMVDGPLPRWEHTHRFAAADGGTLIADRVDWALPGGPAGRLAARLGVVGLAPVFRYRHRRARELLEG